MSNDLPIFLPITPVGAPRMTKRDKWAKRECVVRYFSYKDSIRDFCDRAGYVQGESLDIVFVSPMPASWSKKKTLSFLGKPHKAKADIDNMVKGWLDSLLEEDSMVWDLKAMKFWGINGGIYLNSYNLIQSIYEEKKVFVPERTQTPFLFRTFRT